LADTLHANPETAWQEYQAVDWVTGVLADQGFIVTRKYLGFDTAFLAEYENGSKKIGVMAEYDALTGLDHACGHNLISSNSVGAGLALAHLAYELDLTVRVYGSSDAERCVGKVEMIDAGAFYDLELAMMFHHPAVDITEAEPFAVAHQ